MKVVNPGGISAFKFNQRKLDVDEAHATLAGHAARRWCTRWRARCTSWACRTRCTSTAATSACPATSSRRWRPIDALEGLPAHLTHVQFHSYGTEGAAQVLVGGGAHRRGGERQPERLSIDVGQIMFGQTVTASGDTMRQHRNARSGSPRKWVGADIECDAGCGVVPFRYREQSYVNALQWAIGLELFLLVERPLARGADHRPSQRRRRSPAIRT